MHSSQMGQARMGVRGRRSDFPEKDPLARDGGPVEAASFIAETVAELAQLSRCHGLHMLGHLLEMTQLEAEDFVARRGRSGGF
jgi:hypothetical protein